MKTRTSISRTACPKLTARCSRTACPARLLLLLLLLLALPAVVQAQFIYTANNGTITITGYSGPGGAVEIPDTINGLPVTSIGAYAFAWCTSLTSATIPKSVTHIGTYAFLDCHSLTAITVDALNSTYSSVDGVLFDKSQTTLIECPGGKAGDWTIPNSATSIGDYAFIRCYGLTSVTIGTNVTSIGHEAFAGCWGLTSVTIPNGVTSIGHEAFAGCSRLTAITVDTGNSAYRDVNGVLFNHSLTTLVEYPGGIAGHYTIPNSVTSIGEWAFSGCPILSSVAIPNSVTSIGEGAFWDSANLTSVTIGTNVTSIGRSAFDSCYSLTNVTIPNSVTSIGDYGFYDCHSLTSVTIPNSVTNIGDYVFGSCTSLTSVTIGTNVTSIGDGAFAICTSLTSVTIPNGVTSIGGWAFGYCNNLSSVCFQGNAPRLDYRGVFSVDNSTRVYYLPGTIGWGTMFGGLPAYPWDPPSQAGYTTNNGTVTITGYAGSGGAWTIPSTIGGLPVINIGTNAFDGCASLTSVTIPNSVTGIGSYAFLDCSSLTSVYFQGNAPGADSSVFGGDNNATVYYLPGTTGWGPTFAGLPAFLWDPVSQAAYTTTNGVITIMGYVGPGGSWTIPGTINGLPVTSIGSILCASLTNVAIPSTITNVAGGAFSGCPSLRAITVDALNSTYSSVDGVLFDKSQTTLVEYPCGLGGSYTIPNSVTGIGDDAFYGCGSLTSATMPYSVTNIGDDAFYGCGSLTSVYFQGNAPSLGGDVFVGYSWYGWTLLDPATIYYLPGTTGWDAVSTNTGLPVVLWTPQVQTSGASFGVRTNQFGFTITWASSMTVVVEACTNLADPTWSPVGTNSLTSGSSYFSDAQWTNYPARFYRLRSP